tara:strand:+ start:330 stop:1187 length:858 start_codon:yes stop_codon:yes gene_type:complete
MRSGLALKGANRESVSREDHARIIGAMIREQRELLGLTLRDLATQIRITTPVLEALERGWIDRLPERAYLASMLPQIERRLELPSGCLDPVLPVAVSHSRRKPVRGFGRFTPGSIDVFTTWQGSVVYGAVMLFSLMAINRQQQTLARQNSLALEPVRANVQAIPSASNPSASDAGFTLESLRPLEPARQHLPQDWLKSVAYSVSPNDGVLQLLLNDPSQLKIYSEDGDRMQIEAGKGQLTLQLRAPIKLIIAPPPEDSKQVMWNGVPLKQVAKLAGVYRVEKSSL